MLGLRDGALWGELPGPEGRRIQQEPSRPFSKRSKDLSPLHRSVPVPSFKSSWTRHTDQRLNSSQWELKHSFGGKVGMWSPKDPLEGI